MATQTILTLNAEKKHSVRYDYKGEDYTMSLYVPKDHPSIAEYKTGEYPAKLGLELIAS